MKKIVVASVLASGLMVGTASAAYEVAESRTYGGHAKNSSNADWRTHVHVCDTKDDGHEMEVQARMATWTARARDGKGGSCEHLTQTSSVREFRSCRLMIFDECGGWVEPKRVRKN